MRHVGDEPRSEHAVDERPFVRLVSVLGGIAGGVGAYVYQLAVRMQCRDTPCMVIYMALLALAWFTLMVALSISVGALVMALRSKRREWLVPLYLALPFLATLYLCGGDWPFWR